MQRLLIGFAIVMTVSRGYAESVRLDDPRVHVSGNYVNGGVLGEPKKTDHRWGFGPENPDGDWVWFNTGFISTSPAIVIGATRTENTADNPLTVRLDFGSGTYSVDYWWYRHGSMLPALELSINGVAHNHNPGHADTNKMGRVSLGEFADDGNGGVELVFGNVNWPEAQGGLWFTIGQFEVDFTADPTGVPAPAAPLAGLACTWVLARRRKAAA